MGDTSISWATKVWNMLRGCSRISPGCTGCYAEEQAMRVNRQFAALGRPLPYAGLVEMVNGDPRWTGEVRLILEHLLDPLRWRTPQRIFTNSMSDPHHEKVPYIGINAAWGVMSAASWHTHLMLTKRAEEMLAWHEHIQAGASDATEIWDTIQAATTTVIGQLGADHPDVKRWQKHLDANDRLFPEFEVWPLPNVWPGVSVENRKHGLPRIDLLRQVPAALRFLSIEPLIEDLGEIDLDGIGWVIVGCESGRRPRPCEVDWLRSIRDQCAAANVPFFLKQAVGVESNGIGGTRHVQPLIPARDLSRGAITSGPGSIGTRGVIEMPYLDGRQHTDIPGEEHAS